MKPTIIVGKLTADRKFSGWQLLEGLPGSQLVAAGDFTGDGVDDLVISTNGQTRFFPAIPSTP